MPHREPLLRIWIAGTVTTTWALSIVADIIFPAYDPPAGVHSLMLIVAGGIFGTEVVSAARKDRRT